MKKVVLVLGLVILVGCAAGWAVTYHSLSVTRSVLQASLNEVQAKLYATTLSLTDTQQKLQDTSNGLKQTRQELQNTEQSLKETQQGLAEQKSQTAKYVQLYESTMEELDSTEKDLNRSELENQKIQRELDESNKKLKLYQDTLGIQVYSDIRPLYRSGNSMITLVDNRVSRNPTWQQLEAFLQEDKTDKKIYVKGTYECGNYAQDLHNIAEAKGIRSAWVAIQFVKGEGHALTAFRTVDRGLVYIDVTGDKSSTGPSNLDRIVQVNKGEPLIERLLFPEGWEFLGKTEIVKEIAIYW
jgi:TolA-binding protein